MSMRKLLATILLGAMAFGTLNLGVLAEPAAACPNCKVGNESPTSADGTQENRKPQAYMYSILFMLAMPATLLAGFGIGFYRLSRKQADTSLNDADVPSDE